MLPGMLNGVRVIELGGIGPLPHAGMVLASMGADVVRADRPAKDQDDRSWDGTRRGRHTLELDLKDPDQVERLLQLVESADVFLEGFRPGVAERMGLGPEILRARNAGIVYGRMTGWGQTGPWAGRAGHDINYIGLTGALHAIGTAEGPVPPLNLVGDFGGGSTFLVMGVLGALLRRTATGEGCVVDAAIVDGTSSLMQLIWSLRQNERWGDERGQGLLDGSVPYYRTYRCSDGGWMAVGPLEPEFYAQMLTGLDLSPDDVPNRDDPEAWPALADVLARRFASEPRSHWERVFEQGDACVTPVLRFDEVADHPHVHHRQSVVSDDEGVRVGPAPRRLGDPATTLLESVGTDLDTEISRWGKGDTRIVGAVTGADEAV